MNILGFVLNWPIWSQLWLTSLCISLTGQFHENLKIRLENTLICDSDKASIDHQRAHVPHKLNSIVVRHAFPLPHVDEALQAVHNCQWFTSFNLAQGYLQMPVEEADIQKIAFRAGLSGLYKFTHMPFQLSNSRSSFCCLMEMCLGHQEFCDTPIIPRQHLCICHQHVGLYGIGLQMARRIQFKNKTKNVSLLSVVM